jgi:hypothetical protein
MIIWDKRISSRTIAQLRNRRETTPTPNSGGQAGNIYYFSLSEQMSGYKINQLKNLDRF